MRTAMILAGAALALVATAPVSATRPVQTPDQQLQTMLAGRVAGKPTMCITPSTVSSTQVIDGTAIVYRAGGKLYVNRPRAGASSLRSDDVLVTNITGAQLCSIDTVRLIDRAGWFPRGFVSLGDFVPYTRADRAR